MNYSRGIQPSCISKTEYENMNRKHWHNVKEDPPVEGVPIVGLFMNGLNDPDAWVTDIVYYCDGMFYKLDIDPRLGILRKEYISDKVDYWSHYLAWDTCELK